MDSILTSIKKMSGIDEAYTHFDSDIIFGINTAMMTMNQLGVGPKEGFSITDASSTWADYLGTRADIEGVKSYIYIKTKLLFDPPSSSFVLEAMKEQAKELEWRLNVQVEEFIVEGEVVE